MIDLANQIKYKCACNIRETGDSTSKSKTHKIIQWDIHKMCSISHLTKEWISLGKLHKSRFKWCLLWLLNTSWVKVHIMILVWHFLREILLHNVKSYSRLSYYPREQNKNQCMHKLGEGSIQSGTKNYYRQSTQIICGFTIIIGRFRMYLP